MKKKKEKKREREKKIEHALHSRLCLMTIVGWIVYWHKWDDLCWTSL